MATSAALGKRFEFQWMWFFLSFSVGMLAVYVMADKPTVVRKYPTPWNPSIVYKDETTEGCMTFSSQEVKCSGDVKELPV